MAIYYVGIGGNDGNTGLTWALRKLTLNGAEDVPVVAGDTVYVGPGVYRELLTCDVNGAGGSIITYIGDVTGEHTDDVGGIVRITGSDNDTTTARANCVALVGKDYRTFRGFMLDSATNQLVITTATITDLTFEDCYFSNRAYGIRLNGAYNYDNIICRRCVFDIPLNAAFELDATTPYAGSGNLVENCLFIGGYGGAVLIDGCDGVTVRNCTILGAWNGIVAVALQTNGYSMDVNNCIIQGCRYALNAAALGGIVENYNTLHGNNADRSNVNVGANSNAYFPLFNPPILHAGASQASGFKFPWWISELSEWSQIRAIAGTNEPSVDLRGIQRPATAAKNSWGPTQFHDMERETTTTRTGGVSMTLHDAGLLQIWVPTTAVSTTISVYVYREANYAGTNPRLIVKQPGQADDTTTDANAVSQWNLLTTTLTPAADPPYVVVELQSLNTAVALAYDVFFDDLVVS